MQYVELVWILIQQTNVKIFKKFSILIPRYLLLSDYF